MSGDEYVRHRRGEGGAPPPSSPLSRTEKCSRRDFAVGFELNFIVFKERKNHLASPQLIFLYKFHKLHQ